VVVIMALATLLRCWGLEIKPPHFDEGINGWFADRIAATGYYAYDPTNFHGPWYFYLVHLSQVLFGRELWALRLPSILGSLLSVWLLFRFHPYVGRAGAAFAAAAMAVSPAFVFYGRYSIHESWMVAFNIMALLGLFGLWRQGHKSSLYLFCAGVTGMILTKETYVIHIGSLLLAWPCLLLWNRLVPPQPEPANFRKLWRKPDLAVAIAVSLAAIVAFYSGFGLHWQGLAGLWQTYAAWFDTGVEPGGHAKTSFDLIGPLNWYWIWLMARFEWPVLFGLLACARFLWPSPTLLRYLAIYAGGLWLAYTVIPYKTPWCLLAFAWPFYLVLGSVLQEAWSHHVTRRAALLGGLLLLIASVPVTLSLNFQRFADHSLPYVYVQTDPGIWQMTRPLQAAVRRDPGLAHEQAYVLLESYYPLPWMLGNFTRVHYRSEETDWPAELDGLFVVIEHDRARAVRDRLRGNYREVRFQLRDGMEDAVVFFREDLP